MNYQEEVFDHVFTLAHEAGHSMHSWHSARHQPFEYYDYTIFVAEVASTFNEELLSHYLLEHAGERQASGPTSSTARSTTSAPRSCGRRCSPSSRRSTHAMAEAGEPLTKESFQKVYRKLLAAYFGPEFTLDDELSLECFRIPHFYRAFYVYKYATGISAAIALSQRVLKGGEQELNDYLGFLEGRLLEVPAGDSPRRGSGHVPAGAGGYGAAVLRSAGERAGRAAVVVS